MRRLAATELSWLFLLWPCEGAVQVRNRANAHHIPAWDSETAGGSEKHSKDRVWGGSLAFSPILRPLEPVHQTRSLELVPPSPRWTLLPQCCPCWPRQHREPSLKHCALHSLSEDSRDMHGYPGNRGPGEGEGASFLSRNSRSWVEPSVARQRSSRLGS